MVHYIEGWSSNSHAPQVIGRRRAVLEKHTKWISTLNLQRTNTYNRTTVSGEWPKGLPAEALAYACDPSSLFCFGGCLNGSENGTFSCEIYTD